MKIQNDNILHHGLESTLYQRLIYDWNDTDYAYPNDKTIPQLFMEQVAKTPDNIALIYENIQLTYRELDAASNKLARFIGARYQDTSCELNSDFLIAISLERSLEMVIGILGIMKAGAAYVPIAPTFPPARIAYILKDTGVRMVLTQKHLIASLDAYVGVTLVALDDNPYQEESASALPALSQPDDLAYVIYTSGTTGQPKGVAITHRGIVNRIDWMQRTYPLKSSDVVLQKTPFIFDVSVWELLWAHEVGATIVMASPHGHQDANYLNAQIKTSGITVMHFVPSMLSVFTQALVEAGEKIPSSLRYVFCSGEALTAKQVRAFYALSHHGVELHNLYGPTEASVDVTAFACPRNIDKVLIGKPIQNMQVYVLNEHLQPVKVNVIGELYLGGVGLARGYLNKPELTNERFITHQFITETGTFSTRLYKTGDLVQWLPDGNLEYMGRNDFQVKIRGYRIELSEIEHALLTYPMIAQAVVVVQQKGTTDDSQSYLVAYYVSVDMVHEEVLFAHLQNILPEYMVPSVFVHRDMFPVTINGKLDRAALPKHDFKARRQGAVAPQKTLEKTIAAIWALELDLEDVGIEDNFFSLGGHSLVAVRIVAAISQQLDKQIELADFYRAGNIYNLVCALDSVTAEEKPNIVRHEEPRAKLALADFQLMLWFSHLFEPKAKKMNLVARKRMHGSLDINLLHKALDYTLKKQDAICYSIAKFYPAQHYLQKILNKHIVTQDLRRCSMIDCEEILLADFHSLINTYPWPNNEPLVLVKIFYLPNELVELQLCMPHLIADEVSMEILCRDLSEGYLFYKNSTHAKVSPDALNMIVRGVQDDSSPTHLAEINAVTPFKDYVIDEQRDINMHVERKLAFWQGYLHDVRLFVFPPRYVVSNMAAARLSYSTYAEIPGDALTFLRSFCAKNHVTINDALCAALAIALKESEEGTSNFTNHLLINLIKSTRFHQKYDGTIGCFVRVDPIKVDLNNQPSWSILSKQVYNTKLSTAPWQRLSALLKFSCLTNCFNKKSALKSWLIRQTMRAYTKILQILRLDYQDDTTLNMCWKMGAFERKNIFIVNLNLWNNFMSSGSRDNDALFGLRSVPIHITKYDLLTMNDILDVCFLRDEASKIPYIVISGNLTPSFRESIANKVIQLIMSSKAEATRVDESMAL